jgi:hypothetical protein
MKKLHAILLAAGIAAVVLLIALFKQSPEPASSASEKPANVQSALAPQWQNLLIEYPQGYVGAEQKLIYRFNKPAVGIAQVGKADAERISIRPAIDFSTLWLDESTLQITPLSALPADTKIELTLQSKGLLIGQQLANFEHQVQVVPQQLSIREIGFGNTAQEQALTYQFDVQTLEPIALPALKNMFEVSQSSAQPLPIEWQQQTPRAWRATISGIMKTSNAATMTLRWKETPAANEFAAKRTFDIPLLDQFNLLSSQVQQENDQKFELRFSQIIGKQDLTGLVKLNDKDVRAKVNGNVIQLFPDSPLKNKVKIWISRQLKSSHEQTLGTDVIQELQVSSLLPEIKMLDGGFILPQADRLLIPIEATNIKAIQLRVFEIYSNNIGQYLQDTSRNWQSDYVNRSVGRYIDQQEMMLTQAALNDKQQLQLDVTELVGKHRGSILRIEASILPQHSLYNCDTQLTAEPLVALERLNYEGSYQRDDEIPEHLWRFYQSEGYYDWDERRNPCKKAYFNDYNDKTTVSKVFIASNIGILAKMGGDKQLHILTTNLQKGQAAAGKKVSVFNYQNQLIGEVVTDAKGLAQLKPEGTPYYLKAEGDGDVGYLRIPSNEALPTGQFDTSGVKNSEGVKGFFYAERNVWRPGDNIYLMLILQDKNKQLPADFPVTLDFFDPKNQKVKTLVQRQHNNGFYRFDLSTDEDAQTGNWHVVAKAGGSYFDTSIKIENILPNRLKIELDLPTTPLALATQDFTLSAAWLNGASAQALKTDVELKLSTTPTTFAGYTNYHFDDSTRKFAAESKKIFDGNLDANGKATINFAPELNTPSPGALKAMFIQRVFEPNGQFSTQYRHASVLPYAKWVGLLVPEEIRNSSLDPKGNANIDLVMLDVNGKPISNGEIQLELHELKWRWWWDSDDTSSANYVSDEEIKRVESRKLFTDATGYVKWQMFGKDYASGRYRLSACDASGTTINHCSSQEVYIGWGYGDSSSRDGATRLSLSADKESYQVGDIAKIHLPAGPDREVLLTLDGGSSVKSKQWVKVAKGQDIIEIPLTREMTPNIYAYITQIQPHQNRQNDTPLRSYGILNLQVSDPQSHLQVQIKAPTKVEPESTFVVNISEQQGRAMSYTLAMVDEGLLGITDFHVPEPHAALYQREALGVKTWDLFDDVVGAYSADLSHLLAVGGSELIPKRDGQRERRFKPVVKFFGPFDLAAGAKAEHEIELPPYMGSVRLMVVAGDGYAYGQQETNLTISQPLTLLSTVPRVIGTNEEFALPVALFFTEDQSQTVKVTVTTNELLKAPVAESSVQFTKAGEQTAMLRIKAGDLAGMGKITVTASAGTLIAKEVIDLPVRIANSPVQRSISKVLKPGESWQPSAANIGMAGSNKQWLSASRSPDFGFKRIELSLDDYPFMCVEQATSKVFPLLFQGFYQTPSTDDAANVQKRIQQHLKQLSKYQLGSGQFSYWPRGTSVEEWGNLYAGYFMLRAQQQGYAIDAVVLKQWLNNTKETANSFNDRSSYGISLQAWRLWLLAIADQANIGAMNRLREDLLNQPAYSHATAHHLLALAYAEQSLPDIAVTLQQHGGNTQHESLAGVLNSQVIQQVIQLELASALQQSQQRWQIALQLADKLRNDNYTYNTMETAWAAATLMQQFGGSQHSEAAQISVKNGEAAVDWQIADQAFTDELHTYQADNFAVSNNGNADLYLTLTQQGIPAPGEEKASAQGLSMQTRFTALDGSPLDVTAIKQGTDFIAIVEVFNQSGRSLQDLSLQQVFPAGWQLRNTGLAEDGLSVQLSHQYAGDDRVSSFYALDATGGNARIQIKVTLNASFAGRYYLPAWQANSMYETQIRANNTGSWVEVKP